VKSIEKDAEVSVVTALYKVLAVEKVEEVQPLMLVTAAAAVVVVVVVVAAVVVVAFEVALDAVALAAANNLEVVAAEPTV
jgi:hypothetical protein